MKRVALLALVVLLAGCGGDGGDDSLDQPWRAEAQEYAAHQYGLCAEMGDACREHGYPTAFKSEDRCGCLTAGGAFVDIGY